MEADPSFIQENRLIEIFEPSFESLKLEDLAKIVSLSKRFMQALCERPNILISMIKKFYISPDHVHPKVRRYFKFLLTKQLKLNISNLGGIAKEIYLLAQYRIKISKNLIRNVYCRKPNSEVYEIRDYYWRMEYPNEIKPENPLIERIHGGDGWKLEHGIIPEFRKRTLATSFEQCTISYKTFFQQFPPDFLEDFKNGKTVIKAGCFISRRPDCEANGGCIFQVFDSENHLLFDVKQHKKSEEISSSRYQEIVLTLSFQDLPQNFNLDTFYMKLIIYGKDERWWAGHYGSRFIAMYIRGDYAENPLKKLSN